MTTPRKILFMLPYLFVILASSALWYGYTHASLYYFGFIVTYVIVLIADFLVGEDAPNPAPEEVSILEKERYFTMITELFVPVQIAFFVFCMYLLLTRPLTILESIGIFTTMGVISGAFGVTIAHELGHKNSKRKRFLAQALYTMASYGHFYIEHNKGHHVRVATPDDPATAKYKENFYHFYLNTVIGSWLSAWKIEKKRLLSQNKSAFVVSNRMFWYLFIPFSIALLCGLSGYIWKDGFFSTGVVFFFAQSFIAFSLLELVNYVEHYGLARKKISEGRYEKVNPTHSWNANQLLTNAFLFHLQRHPHHHEKPNINYQCLKTIEKSPQLPFGYAAATLLALFPPLWFKIMNPILESYYQITGMKPLV